MGNKQETEQIIPEIINFNINLHSQAEAQSQLYNIEDIKIIIHQPSQKDIQPQIKSQSSSSIVSSEQNDYQIDQCLEQTFGPTKTPRKKISGQSTNIELTNLQEQQQQMEDYKMVKRIKKFRCSEKY